MNKYLLLLRLSLTGTIVDYKNSCEQIDTSNILTPPQVEFIVSDAYLKENRLFGEFQTTVLDKMDPFSVNVL